MATNHGDEVKDSILRAALDLFADKGVLETYVRDISKRAGIRESTLYYYYSGKEDIINTMSEIYNQSQGEVFLRISTSAIKEDYLDLDVLSRLIKTFTVDYLLDDFAIKYERIMRMELSRNARIGEDYINTTFILPVQFLEKLMQFLVHIGFIREVDAKVLAETLVAMVGFIFTKHLGVADLTDDIRDAYVEDMDRFIRSTFGMILVNERLPLTDDIRQMFRDVVQASFPSLHPYDE